MQRERAEYEGRRSPETIESGGIQRRGGKYFAVNGRDLRLVPSKIHGTDNRGLGRKLRVCGRRQMLACIMRRVRFCAGGKEAPGNGAKERTKE